MLTEELRYRLLKALQLNPEMTQREMAKELDVSLGRVNYCINALLEIGLIKAKNFKNNQNKLSYYYLLTPKGIENKRSTTIAFLQHKIGEYESILQEIEELKKEAKAQNLTIPLESLRSLDSP